MLPPSVHPDTHRPYEFITGLRARDELPEMPPALLHIWQHWNDLEPVLKRLAGCESPPPRKPNNAKARSDGHHDDVIGKFNARYTAAEIIERNGYQPRGKRWIHPDSTTSVAGVIQFPDGCLFAHGGGALADGKPHDAFDCFKILEHGGDITHAVREAAAILGIERAGGARPPASRRPTRFSRRFGAHGHSRARRRARRTPERCPPIEVVADGTAAKTRAAGRRQHARTAQGDVGGELRRDQGDALRHRQPDRVWQSGPDLRRSRTPASRPSRSTSP